MRGRRFVLAAAVVATIAACLGIATPVVAAAPAAEAVVSRVYDPVGLTMRPIVHVSFTYAVV